MKRREIFLVLHNVRSAENVGSIFRTADAVGAAKIYLCGITPRPDKTGGGAKIKKTALGAERFIAWEYHKQTRRLLEKLRAKGLWLVSLEQAQNSQNIFGYRPPKNKSPVLIVGNEIKGLSSKILQYADVIVQIPMRGRKESLNVAVAAGVALYQFIESKK